MDGRGERSVKESHVCFCQMDGWDRRDARYSASGRFAAFNSVPCLHTINAPCFGHGRCHYLWKYLSVFVVAMRRLVASKQRDATDLHLGNVGLPLRRV